MPAMYERPKCCKAASNGGVYWMPAWYDGPEKEGWAVSCEKNYCYPAWVNVVYCPYCGAKLKTEG